MSLSPCILPWHTATLSPGVSPAYHPEPGDVLSPPSPEPSTPGGVTLYRPSPEPTAPGEATSPGGNSGLATGDTTAFSSYLKVESPTLPPSILPPPASLLGGDDDSAINLIFKEEDVTSDEDDNSNNVLDNSNNGNNHGNNENSNDTCCTNQDENANCLDRRACATKKTLTTLETFKSPTGVSGSSSAHTQYAQHLQQLGSYSNPYQPISPTFLSNGGFPSGMNGYGILQNGSNSINSTGIPNALCTGYGSGMMNGSATSGGGGGYPSNGYYPMQGMGTGVGGGVYPGGGYGASSTNRSCAVASLDMYNSPLGCSTSSSLQPCDLSIISCSLTSSPPSLSPMPPSLSPISPTSFSSSSCIYPAWRSGGLTAVAAAASGITGAVTPPPSTNTNTHTHPYLHPPAHHNGYSSLGGSGSSGGAGQGGILTAHNHAHLPPTYSTGLTRSSLGGTSLTTHHPPGGTLSYSAPTPSPTPTVTPTVSLHSSVSEHRHSFFIKGKTFLISFLKYFEIF